MGSACCVAARDTTLLNGVSRNGDSQRNARYSPSWSFQWDNNRRVAGEIGNPSYQSCERMSSDFRMEMKNTTYSVTEQISDRGSPLENLGTTISQESPSYKGTLCISPSGYSCAILCRLLGSVVHVLPFSYQMNDVEPPEIAPASVIHQFSRASSSSFSTLGGYLCVQRQLLSASSTPSRWGWCSPGHQLFRQISNSRILGLKSPNSSSLSEGRAAFLLSNFNNDLAGGSSHEWSMCPFSELLVSSQRERWSFDSEQFGSGCHKIGGSNSRFSCSPSLDLQTCGACLKALAEIYLVAILHCGHVYHAECLETMTTEADKYDPICPICTVGQKKVSKLSRKVLREEAELKMKFQQISRNRVIDGYLDDEVGDLECQKITRKGKFPKMGSSSCSKNSFAKTFFRRDFSLASKRSKSSLENEPSQKMGFWARYRND
ncbi:hypothetical protein Cgig2_003410 [Carnegiea gigantea]|uniref:RING-type domain-containing protein n=1 Tax=Carnegiea gigantea TaxID=171969 RepID=A0A9Q1QEJ0_9CARY|nr:hypothetical protein Cgig2_003410 [Carnegiea gigantea]